MKLTTSRAMALVLATAIALAACGPTAGPGDYQGPSFAGSSPSPSGSKPESKVWFHDGAWWAVMFDTASTDFHLWKLNQSNQTWQNTGVKADDRSNTRFDLLFDGTKLYVASHIFTESPGSGPPSELYRYSYNGGTWSLDAGFPAVINDVKTETLVLAKDSTGQLWTTWTEGSPRQVYVNRTLGDDATWGTPYVLPAAGSTVASDDISSIIAFGGDRIGVFWSNQSDQQDYFSIHLDTEPTDTMWLPSEVAYSGSGAADDHINLKADASGQLYVVTKTASALIPLLVRNTAGTWSSYTVAPASENWTRPILLLDEQADKIYVFATKDPSGGDIVRRNSSKSSISFGSSTVAIRDDANPDLNNATSTKQSVSSATGLVVLATNGDTQFYWHYWDPLTG